MDVDKLASHVRGYAGDFAKTQYSDFQVLDAINSSTRLLVERCVKSKTALFRKSTTLTVSDGTFALPDDFVSLVRAYDDDGGELYVLSETTPAGEGEVLIHGMRGFSGEDQVSIVYDALPSPVERSGDDIDLSEAWELPLARTAAYFLRGEPLVAMQALDAFLGGVSSGGAV